MNGMIRQITILALWLSCDVCLAGSAQGAPTAGRPQTTALIVGGISRDPVDQSIKTQAVANLKECLLKRMNVDPRRLTILAADKPDAPAAAQVAQAIDAIAGALGPNDKFIFLYLGQANAAGGELRFNLAGPDMTQTELADRLKAIKAGHQLIVLDCPCAGLAAKALAAPGRIVACASTATQPLGTQFSPHFVRVLGQPQTDANNDGKISLLEAFAATAREIEQWYRQKNLLPTETPCLEDDGDGAPSERPWKYETEGGDGLKASTFWLLEGR